MLRQHKCARGAHVSDEFIVESILGHTGDFKKKNSFIFHVRWLGYTPKVDTWEPWKNVMQIAHLSLFHWSE